MGIGLMLHLVLSPGHREIYETKLQAELEEYEDASNELMLLDDESVRT